MTVNIYATVDLLLEKLAQYFVESANQSITDHGRFTVALSGGSSPEKLYALLASPVFVDKTDWNKVYFFFGDERYVPLTDPASNYRMVNKVLFEPLQINRSHIFAVNTTLAPADAAVDYMKDIDQLFESAEPRFDLILLGLGDNSHTASLFPFTDILYEKEAAVRSVFLKDQQIYRISFTAPLINMAARIAYLVYGDAKAEAVKSILEGQQDVDIEKYPARLVHPGSGELEWFLDKAAASKLSKAE